MNTNLSITLLTALITSTLITSCSNNYLSTNLDKGNFDDYFSASNIKIYQSEKAINGRYQFIGSVEGQDCQVKPHHAVPDEINARTQARQQAYNEHANGVVFSNCVLLSKEQLQQLNNSNDAQQCHAIVVCYAKAYQIETKTNVND